MGIARRKGEQSRGPSPALLGYDVLRIVAMALVAVQHVLTISGAEPAPFGGRLNVGQLGVTIFCGLSGYFALRSAERSPLRWLVRRLAKIYPAYWVVLTAVLLANHAVNYKPASLGLVLSEFAGTGYLTHGNQLIGVPFWFISLILLCYGVGVVLRCRPGLTPLAVLMVAVALPLHPWFGSHLLSFVSGALLSRFSRPRVAACALVVLFAGATWVVQEAFAYPVAAILAVMVGGIFHTRSPWALTRMAEGTYEFFLVHGPIYLALATFVHLGVAANAVWGTACSVIAAYLLWHTVRSATRLLALCLGWHQPGIARGPASLGPAPNSP